jgi:putative tricarboxylic transport membrane protein
MGFTLEGLNLGFGNFGVPGPGFLPVLIGGVLAGLSLGLFVKSLLLKTEPEEIASFWKEKGSWKKVLFTLLSLVLYLFFLDYLGYILTTFLFLCYLVKFIGKRGWVVSLSVSILATVISYGVFARWMEVPLPRGIFNIG